MSYMVNKNAKPNQAAVMASRPSFCITHAPGHMFITDVTNAALKL